MEQKKHVRAEPMSDEHGLNWLCTQRSEGTQSKDKAAATTGDDRCL